jgi:hypothetical protein
LAWREGGRRDRDAKPELVTIGYEHDGHAVRLAADRQDGESASEEGMGRVRYLDFLRESRRRRVVERGIMVGFRSTISRIA